MDRIKFYIIALFVAVFSISAYADDYTDSGSDFKYTYGEFFNKELWETGLEFEYDDLGDETVAVIKCRYEDKWKNEFIYYTPAIKNNSGFSLIEIKTGKGTFKSQDRTVMLIIDFIDPGGNRERSFSVEAQTRSNISDTCQILQQNVVKIIWNWLTSNPDNAIVITAERHYPYSDFRMIANSN